MRADVDVVTVQQLHMAGADDNAVLDRALTEDRVVITSDRNTMLGFRHARVALGTPAPGIVVIDTSNVSFRTIADDIVFLADTAQPRDWANPILVPLR